VAAPQLHRHAAAAVSTNGDELASPITFRDGAIRFDPPNSTDGAVSDSVVRAAFEKTGVLGAELAGHTPKVFLADLTDYSRSNALDPATNTLVPNTTGELVWVLRYSGVAVPAMGTPKVGVPYTTIKTYGADTSSSGAPVSSSTEDVIVYADASTGNLENLFTADQDQTVMPAPPHDPSKR
jgi:hypothetical protein